MKFSIIKKFTISKRIVGFVLMFLIYVIGYSQEYDKIYLKNKEVYTGKVVRVTSENIEIKLKEDSSLKKINKNEVKLIIYSDNEVFFVDSKSAINVNETKVNSRFKGFRTDGYYITSYPIEYNYELIKEKFRRTRSFENIILYIAFRVLPEDIDNEDNNAIQAAIFYEKKYEFLRKFPRKTPWKTVHDEFLFKEKVNRTLIENKLNKEFDDLKWFQWESKVLLIKLKQSGLTFFLSHFSGLKENIPRINILIGNDSGLFGWNFKSNEYNSSEFYKFYSDVNSEMISTFTLYKNQELYFVPYKLNN